MLKKLNILLGKPFQGNCKVESIGSTVEREQDLIRRKKMDRTRDIGKKFCEDERPAKRAHFNDDDPINDVNPHDDDPHVFNLKPLLENILSYAPLAEKSFFGQEVTVSHNPFPLCVAENFLRGSNMINDLIGGLENMNFEKNQTDMFQLSMFRKEPTKIYNRDYKVRKRSHYNKNHKIKKRKQKGPVRLVGYKTWQRRMHRYLIFNF